MPLDESDRAHLIQLGHQCKASGHPLYKLTPWLKSMNPAWFPTVRAICMNDAEWQDLGVPPLIRWAGPFSVRVGANADPVEMREIEETLQEGWNQG